MLTISLFLLYVFLAYEAVSLATCSSISFARCLVPKVFFFQVLAGTYRFSRAH